MRVGPRLLLGDPALVDQALDERVVLGQLGQLAVAEQVAPAVADVADADLAAVEQRCGDRRARALELGVLVDELGDPVVGAVDGAGDGLEEVTVGCGVEVVEQLRAVEEATSPRGTAHPVGDDEQVLAGVPGVLVVLADPPDVGQGGVAQAQGVIGRGGHRRYFLSSKVVLPIRIWEPSCSVVGWLIRWEPM